MLYLYETELNNTGVLRLAEAFSRGALPRLEELNIFEGNVEVSDEAWGAMVSSLEVGPLRPTAAEVS